MFYVSCTDSFMSGWGEAKDLKNKLIFECKNDYEVEKIADILEKRNEMKYIYKYTDNFPKSLLEVKNLKTEDTFYQLKSAEKWIKMNEGG